MQTNLLTGFTFIFQIKYDYIMHVIYEKFKALTFSHYLSSGDMWPCEYVPPWVGVGFPSIFPNVSARVCNQIPTFQESGLPSKKEQNSCVRVLNLIGSDIDGSRPGSLFPLEQRCVLKGRACSSEQGVLLDIMNLLEKKKTVAELVSCWT